LAVSSKPDRPGPEVGAGTLSRRAAAKTAGAYAFVSSVWVLCSDRAVELLSRDADAITTAGTIKGWLFVAVTALLLYGLLRRMLDRIVAAASREINSQSEKLNALRLLESIAENSEDAIFAKDTEGRYVLFNRAAGAFVGKTPGEVLGKDDRALFPRDQAQMLMAAGREVIAKDRAITKEEELDTPMGPRVFLATKAPLRDADERVIGVFGISRDITRRKAAERALQESNERLRALVNTIPDLVWLKDAEGKYLACNPRFEQFFGAAEADIVGRPDYNFLPAELADLFRANDRAAMAANGPTVNEEEATFAADGHREILQTIKTPFFDGTGNVIGVLGIARDITAQKAAEAELRKNNEELQRFNRATVGRELDMIDLKQQVNAMALELGRRPVFAMRFLDPEDSPQSSAMAAAGGQRD
jgi:PAS domain S-box-containing protein